MDAYAAQARLHMGTYGTTQRQLAAIAAKNHGHSQHNPLSQYRNAMTIDEVLAAPKVAWPLTVPMCAPISDGATAAIVCADSVLGRFPNARPVRVLAVESQSGREREPAAYDQHVTRVTSLRAYEKAGVGPKGHRRRGGARRERDRRDPPARGAPALRARYPRGLPRSAASSRSADGWR